jgi:hypothetical protein
MAGWRLAGGYPQRMTTTPFEPDPQTAQDTATPAPGPGHGGGVAADGAPEQGLVSGRPVTADPARREEQAMEHLTERLFTQYGPGRSQQEVASVVTAIHRRFDQQPIRDYVPVLVERLARQELDRRSAEGSEQEREA